MFLDIADLLGDRVAPLLGAAFVPHLIRKTYEQVDWGDVENDAERDERDETKGLSMLAHKNIEEVKQRAAGGNPGFGAQAGFGGR